MPLLTSWRWRRKVCILCNLRHAVKQCLNCAIGVSLPNDPLTKMAERYNQPGKRPTLTGARKAFQDGCTGGNSIDGAVHEIQLLFA